MIPGSTLKSRNTLRFELYWLVPLAAWTAFQTLLAGGSKLITIYSMVGFGIAALVGGVAVFWMVIKLSRSGVDDPLQRLRQLLAARWPRVIFILLGIQLSSLSFAAFTRLKLQIPAVIPFYADPALADFDYWIFGQDAWTAFGSIFGWASPLMLTVYWFWAPVQMIAYPSVLLCPPSRQKAHVLLTHVLMWAIVGTLFAFAWSSVGPIFYDRLLGGDRFAGLDDPKIGAVANYLWRSYIHAEPGLGVGISAMPSMHVAGAVWLALVIRTYIPRLAWIGWAYAAVIYVGSVLTGWHYATDGVVGAIGAVACWLAVGRLLRDRIPNKWSPDVQLHPH